MFQLITALLAGAAALVTGIVIYNLYVAYLSYSIARRLASEEIQGKSLAWDRVIVEEIERGNVSVVKLGIFNRGTKSAEIRIKADSISDDLTRGSILLT